MPTKAKPGKAIPANDADLERRDYSQKERDAMDDSDFAGPHQSFPIKTQQDVHNAARLIGHADDPEAVKAKIKAIAKRKGFALPKEWQDEEDKASSDRAALPDANAAPTETDAPIERSDAALPASDILYYAPITRIDRDKREIIGTATAEVKDSFGTVIGYEASKDAFSRWRGNIREMHDPKRAVGRALEIMPDDEHRRIVVRAKISKGSEDTWQKILDGTLTGFSIGGKNGKWTERVIAGEKVPYLERYDQAELSVVDNPSCPGADIAIVRADGIASDVLAPETEVEASPSEIARNFGGVEADVERAGARISADTREAMHQVRDHALNAAKSAMNTCGCDDCKALCDAMAGDSDGDGDGMRGAIAEITRLVDDKIAQAIRDQLGPVVSRVNALLAHDAQRSTESPEITRRVNAIDEQLAAIKEICEKIAAQPVGDGPVLHGAPMDKMLATQNRAARTTDGEAIQRAMELGFAPPVDPQEAIRAAAKLIKPIPR